MTVYMPAFQSQFGWGTRYDDQNCTMACGAMLLDRFTLGRIVTNAPNLRKLSGVGETPDGTSMTDVAYAIQKGYDIRISNPGPFEKYEVFEKKVREGRGAIIAGDCAYVRGKARCPAGLARNHALYVNEIDDDGNATGWDPAERTAAEGRFTLTRNQLRRYAGNWARDGFVNAAYSRKTPIDGTPPSESPTVPDLTGAVGAVGLVGMVALGGVAVIGAGVLFWYLGKRAEPVMEGE